MNVKVSPFDLLGHITEDESFFPTHISLYIALLKLWHLNHYKSSFRIDREEVMKLSKIKSIATYHKCMKELDYSGFIVYSPSFNTYRGSLIDILSPSHKKEQKLSREDNQCCHIDAPKFISPSFFEVELYFNEKSLSSIDAKEFFDFYNQREWRRINDKAMRSWQSAARNWIMNSKNKKHK